MKINYFFILSFIAIYFNARLQAQEPRENWTLEAPESGNKTYVAREEISLKPGFAYKSSPGNEFTAKIDPMLLFPPTENTYIDRNGDITTSPAQGAVVGSASGTFDVSPTGAATYSIQIEVPPGIQGMQPNISLVYNSQSGNGIAGWGWSLSGLSTITLGSKTIFSDDAISKTGTDYYLDGNKLILKSSQPKEYETENKTYLKIREGVTPQFTVTSKDGTVMEYGQGVTPKGMLNPRPFLWLLTKVTDSNGNYMTYIYKTNTAGTQTVLESISYGSNGTTPSPLKVQFYYTANPYPKRQHISGGYLEDAQRLDYITVTSNAGSYQLRKYDLNHVMRDKMSLMTTVAVTGENNEALPLINFEYGADAKTLTTKTKTIPDPTRRTGTESEFVFRHFAAADITGDGVANLVQFASNEPKDGGYINHHVSVYDTRTNTVIMDRLIGSPTTWGKNNLFQGNRNFADFNGDGKKTIIVPQLGKYAPSGPKEVRYYDVNYLVSGNNIYDYPYVAHPLTANDEIMPIFAIADMNNDGRDEIISIEISKRKTNTGVSSPGKIFYVKSNNYPSKIESVSDALPYVPSYGERDKPSRVYVADFNADGLKDILVVRDNSSYLSFFINNGGTKDADGIVRVSFTNKEYDGTFSNMSESDCAGDFNGDGLLDFLAGFNLYLGTGDILSPFNKISTIGLTGFDASVDCIVMDIDHDGMSDIIAVGSNTVTWWKSNGTSFTKKSTITTNNKNFSKKGYAAVGDFDGDGREDLFSYRSNLLNGTKSANISGYINGCFNASYNANLLTKVTDRGFGKMVEIYYHPLTYPKTSDGKDFYTKASTAQYPTADVQPPLYAVRQSIEEASGRRLTDYSYARGKMNLTGKGFLGFEEITAANTTLNKRVKTATVNEYDKCLPKEQTVTISTADGKTLISTVKKTFRNDKAGKIYASFLEKTIETDNLSTLSKTTEYLKYDDQGNLTQSRVRQGGLTIVEDVVFARKGTWAWGLNKPVSITTSYKYERQNGTNSTITTSEIRKKSLDYDSKGRITNEIIDPDDANQLVTYYSDYDVFGHPKTVTTKAKVMNAAGSYWEVMRTVANTYTTSGRFLLTEKNPQGETTTRQWDEKRGVLNSVTDHYNRKTAYEYDNFGRLKLTVYPDKNKTVNGLQWAGTIQGKPVSAKYYSYEETSGQSPVWTWYNALGKEIRTDSYGLNRKKVLVDTEHNVKGQITRVSEPYFENTAKTWAATYTYDANDGRVSSVATPMGTTAYAYSGLTTTVTSPSDTRKTTINTTGRVVEEVTNGKTVTFTHDAAGRVTTATPEGGTGTLEMRYDLQGNRTYLNDPDAGVVESKYDGFGQLSWESQKVHKNGNATDLVKTIYTYLADGRLNYTETKGKNTTKITYGYDANKRVNTISQPGHTQTFTYDNLDHITKVNENTGTEFFERQTSYDAFGRVIKETYPSGYYTLNEYDKHGILTAIKDNSGRLIWQALNENAKGQITEEKKGQKTTKYTYDKRGFTTAVQYGISDLAGITYTYDSKGNLTHKGVTAASNQQNASYTYDSHNRLTDWTYSSPTYVTVVNGIPNYSSDRHSIVYDPTTGNISKKSDLDNHLMTYGLNNKPHALTSIAGRPGIFPAGNLEATYTDFKKLQTLKADNKTYALTYGVDKQRRKSVYSIGNAVEQTKYYFGNYEEEIEKSGNVRKIHYLRGAVFIDNSTKTDEFYYTYGDNIGSLIALVNENGTVAEHYAYDPWGNRLNPTNWRERDTRTSIKLSRGFTEHEHIDPFGIINMNGRVYDPLTSQFLSPDPYLQTPENWLNYNRYGYCYNNPLKYTDPSGEFIEWVIIGIAAGIGVYQGNKIAEAKGYDFGDWQTWGYMLGGAVIGGGSAYLGMGIAAGGGFMANTMSIVVPSYVNSMGMSALSGGMITPSINFGVASYNFGTGEWGYLGKKGNSTLENIGYGLGALANLSDVLMGLKSQKVDLVTENSDAIGHSAIVEHGTRTGTGHNDPNGLISVGPDRINQPNGSWHWMKGTNQWKTYSAEGNPRWIQSLDVNYKTIKNYSNWLNKMESSGKLIYSLELSSCVTHTSAALNLSGVFNIGLHPYLLHGQMYLWGNGIRPWTFNYLPNP